MNALMIVGTDTGVGKTTLCELLLADAVASGASVGIYKPVCTGSETGPDGEAKWSDIERLHAAGGGQFARDLICPQRFHAPLAPPVAARLEHRQVDEDLLLSGLNRWRPLVKTLLIEGVGGLLCPVSENLTVADLAARWQAPIVVVSASRLGTISHTLLTLEVAERRGLHVAGWVMNQLDAAGAESCSSNIREIQLRTSATFLGTMPWWEGSRLQNEDASSRMISGGEARSMSEVVSLARPI